MEAKVISVEIEVSDMKNALQVMQLNVDSNHEKLMELLSGNSGMTNKNGWATRAYHDPNKAIASYIQFF